MCGRYSQLRSWSELAELYGLAADQPAWNLSARYNVAPGQPVPIVRVAAGETDRRELVEVRWGLIPAWAQDAANGAKLINARSETVDEKPSFRTAFRSRRCLVPADGFYEWQPRPTGPKQPFFITLADGRPFAFAGLWEVWKSPEGERIESCTILTTSASEQLTDIHGRMPVIFDRHQFAPWLDGQASRETLLGMLRPYPGNLEIRGVGRRVNDVRNDDASCVAPLDRQ
jgi:putative SOS response-associated peptidase YedK